MKAVITDTLTKYLEEVYDLNMQNFGDKTKTNFISDITDYGEVPIEDGSLIESPNKYSVVTSTGYRANIKIVYSGDAPYSYRITRPWTDFLPDLDYAAFQHEVVERNKGYLEDFFWEWAGGTGGLQSELMDFVEEYYWKHLADNAQGSK